MTFRKDSLLFIESQVIYITFLLLSPALISPLGFLAFAGFAALFLTLILANQAMHKEYITINEVGISCHKTGILLWSYNWENITQLKKSSRFCLPCMEIVLNIPSREDKAPEYEGRYFQLGKAARAAIEKYYKAVQ